MEFVMLSGAKHPAHEILRVAQDDSFAEPGCVRQGWYRIARSRALRGSKVRAVAIGPHRVVAYRDFNGQAHVTDDRCAHLGADLSRGAVTNDGLRCAFHGWCFGADGACTAAPGVSAIPKRRLLHHAVEERWGFVFAWLGSALPAFPLPGVPAEARVQMTLPPQRVRAHPDTVLSNGFDLAHLWPSHGIEATTIDVEEKPPWEISHHFEGRLSNRLRLSIGGIRRAPFEVTFTQYGGGLVFGYVTRPVEQTIVFTCTPDAEGHSRIHTMIFLPRRRDLVRALCLVWSTALDDIPLMETIAWTRGFSDADAVLERYVRFVAEMPQWRNG